MGQNFKATKPTIIDDMLYTPPWKLMSEALATKQKGYDESILSTQTFLEKLNADTLGVDAVKAKEIMDSYEKKIEDQTKKLQADPMNFEKQLSNIRTLGRDINQTWNTGTIAKMAANKSLYLDYAKELDALHAKNPEEYSADRIEALKADALERFNSGGGTALNSETGNYRQFSGESALGLKSAFSYMEEIMKNAVPDVNTSTNGKGTKKWFSKEQLNNLFVDFINTDPNFKASVAQAQRLGLPGFEGSTDEAGNPILDSKELNYYGAFKQSLENKYGGKRIDTIIETPAEILDRMRLNEKYKADRILSQIGVGIGGETTKGYFGANAIEFEEKRSLTRSNKKAAISKAVSALGDAETPKAIAEIEAGNFSSVPDPTLRRRIENEYKTVLMEEAAQNSLLKQFNEEYPFYQLGSKQSAQHLTEYLSTKVGNDIPLDLTRTWKSFNVTDNQVATLAKNVEANLANLVIVLPQKIKGLEALENQNMTIGDLLRANIIEEVSKPVLSNITQSAAETVTGDDGTEITLTPSKLVKEYKIVKDPGKYLSFDISTGAIAPVIGRTDEIIRLGAPATIGGVPMAIEFGNLPLAEIEEFKQLNQKEIEARGFFTRASNLKEFKFPGERKVIYYPKGHYDKQTGKEFGPGTVIFYDKEGKNYAVGTLDNPATFKAIVETYF